ncbi:MAG: LysE type translocator [Planctomycetes bacterium ADurb.Bin126]|nr:MAG: LysE type translocator [Planctomycetes bacterium ADurb.Bin126]HOD84915.1 LysE family transporter [Phycisphaerae bacterium]HQL74591.1 LysE family transporter [Phycisphaerae bacterium]
MGVLLATGSGVVLGDASGITGSLWAFLATAAAISLSGVLAPGPVTAATLVAGTRHRHAGAWIAVGHLVVEVPLILLVTFGLARFFQYAGVQAGIALAGGGVLIFMGVGMLLALRKPLSDEPEQAAQDAETAARKHRPLITGVLLSAGNPYFLLWWATVGLKLTGDALSFGLLGLGLFTLVHWSCDLVWLEALSLASHGGTKLMGRRVQQVILAVCGAALAIFGLLFLYDGGRRLLGT